MPDVVVVEAVRTPFARVRGALAGTHPVDLLGAVLAEVVARSGVPASDVDQVIAGCAEKTGEQGFNIARTAWVSAGLPIATGAMTLDTQCGSSQQALTVAHALVAAGLAGIVVACGVESMSRVPMGTTFTSGPGTPIPPSFMARFAYPDQFASAERIATRWGISRRDCDDLAVESNRRADAAGSGGVFDSQLLPIGQAARDDCVRISTRETVAELNPVGDGVHTAATASKIADGASAVLIMSADRAAEAGIPAMARIRDSILVGVDPDLMLTGPISATSALLARSRLTAADLDVIEVNEAFASVVLAWSRETGIDAGRTNPHGGALALGHPIGATGTALLTKAVHELVRCDGELALVTMCCGGGLGTGTLLERC